MFKSSLCFLKNMNIGLFNKINIYIKKPIKSSHCDISNFLSIFIKKSFLSSKELKIENFFIKKNSFHKMYFFLYEITFIVIIIEILLCFF